MNSQSSDIETKIDRILIFHVENTPAHENDRWSRIAESMNNSIKDHMFDSAEEFSAKTAEFRYQELMRLTKEDIEAETDFKLLFYNEKIPLDEINRWSKIAEEINKSMNERMLDSSTKLSAEAAEYRYGELMEIIKAEMEVEDGSQATEADAEDENDSQVTEADTKDEHSGHSTEASPEDEVDSQVTEADTEDENDGYLTEADAEDHEDGQFTKAEIEDEIDWKLCATHMHQREYLKYETPDWADIAVAVNELIDYENFWDVDMLTAETVEARYYELEAKDNSYWHNFHHFKQV